MNIKTKKINNTVEKTMNNEEQERFNLAKSLAEQGDCDAQCYLAAAYCFGNKGVEKNDEEAAKWLKLSAEQGDKLAQFLLGSFYRYGNGVEQNYEEAFKWFKLSAEQGYSSGQLALGKCYYYGRGREQNYEEAVKWLKLSAEQGNVDAQGHLADCYYYGTGTEQNYEEAINLLSPLAEQGNSNAQRRLADCYYYGAGTEQNYEKALKWLTLSAEQGDEEAQSNLEALKFQHFGGTINYFGKLVTKKELDTMTGQLDYNYKNFAILPRGYFRISISAKLINGGEISMSIKDLKEKAKQGDAEAQFYLGNEYYESGNYEEAFKCWKLSAEQGIAFSQYNIGAMIFESFDLCNKKGKMAFEKKAMYEKSWLGNQGLEQSFKWFFMAAKNGIGKAQSKVGQAFLFGWGVETNHDEAIKWYEKAAKNGETDANINLSTLYMNRKEYSKAFKIARDEALQSKSYLAYYNVGIMYLNGLGVKQDPYEAYIWLERAVNTNDTPYTPVAEFVIGRMLLTGWGVKKDVDEAIKYLKKAAEKGDMESEILLAKVEKRTQVFVSYSHKDKQYEEELREHLEGLAYSGIINYWDDEKIEVGDNIDEVIEEEMSKAKVIIFLVSPSFMSSRYVRTVELDMLIDAAENEGARIIWIPVRSCLINGTRLERYRGLIDKNEFLADKEKLSDRDKIYTKAAKIIMEQVRK